MKPATPLPWHVENLIHAPSLDIRFAVHAANNYPRLVAALRYFAKTSDPHGSSQWLNAWSDLNALLRELGEE